MRRIEKDINVYPIVNHPIAFLSAPWNFKKSYAAWHVDIEYNMCYV